MTTSKRTLSKSSSLTTTVCAAEEIAEEEERNIPVGLTCAVKCSERNKESVNWTLFSIGWFFNYGFTFDPFVHRWVTLSIYFVIATHSTEAQTQTLWFSCFHIDARNCMLCRLISSVVTANCWRKLFILLFPSDNTRRDFHSCVWMCDRSRE